MLLINKMFLLSFRSGVIPTWTLDNSKHKASVQCLHCYDMTGDGVLDLLVGRQDGSLQVYTLPIDETEDALPPAERFSYVCIILSYQLT